MKKEFQEYQAANNGTLSTASPSKKRGRPSKTAKAGDAEEEEAEVDGTPLKKQRRARKTNVPAAVAKAEAKSDDEADDEALGTRHVSSDLDRSLVHQHVGDINHSRKGGSVCLLGTFDFEKTHLEILRYSK
ncbi:uncharacterized protein PG998_007938 [Apiospora kogelbergensis]|uniref:uncharacterized protein n=1 Tax=Apiospora kogelbergensis TaxID=1337665 RepID=UPI00312E270D